MRNFVCAVSCAVLWFGPVTQVGAEGHADTQKICCANRSESREPAELKDLLGAPVRNVGPRSTQHLLGGVMAHRAELVACQRRFAPAATQHSLVVQLRVTIGADGVARDVSARAPNADFAGCVAEAAARFRYPPACEPLTVEFPLSAGLFMAPRAVEAARPDFWEWSQLEVPEEALLVERVSVAERLLRNLRPGQVRTMAILGESAFGLQKYARLRSLAALRERQRQTLAGFGDLLRESPSHPQSELALLALMVTLCELERDREAEILYARLLARRPKATSQWAAWAHLTMAERAARAGERTQADERYARVLAALPAEERVYAYAFARRVENASKSGPRR